MDTKESKKPRKNGGSRLSDHDTSITLGNPELVFKAFMHALQEGDSESALEILAGGLRHLNKSAVGRKYRIPRRTLYNLLDKKSVPSLEVVAKVCRAIKQESLRK